MTTAFMAMTAAPKPWNQAASTSTSRLQPSLGHGNLQRLSFIPTKRHPPTAQQLSAGCARVEGPKTRRTNSQIFSLFNLFKVNGCWVAVVDLSLFVTTFNAWFGIEIPANDEMTWRLQLLRFKIDQNDYNQKTNIYRNTSEISSKTISWNRGRFPQNSKARNFLSRLQRACRCAMLWNWLIESTETFHTSWWKKNISKHQLVIYLNLYLIGIPNSCLIRVLSPNETTSPWKHPWAPVFVARLRPHRRRPGQWPEGLRSSRWLPP